MPEVTPDPGSTDDFGGPRWFTRGDIEFGRAVAYVDATFAIATTLLVTTLDLGSAGWASWSGFADAAQGPLLAFGLSFVVVSMFWWFNHRFVASLRIFSGRFVVLSVAMLAFVVLIPFSTQGLGEFSGEVPTVVYALNVAAVSLMGLALFHLAVKDDLFRGRPSSEAILEKTVGTIDTPIVFLLSVPVALFWSAGIAKLLWLSLFGTSFLSGRWVRRRRQARTTP